MPISTRDGKARLAVLLLLSAVPLTAPAADQEAQAGADALAAVDVQAVPGPNRYLQFELVVPVSAPVLWRALTDSDELASWAGPAAHVELRRDGAWDVYFRPDAPPGQRGSENRLLGVVPQRMLIIEAGAPASFPTVKREKTIAIFELEPLDAGRTRLRMTQTGWKNGEEWDAAFDYLAAGNREWLSWLYERFTTGPKQWPAPAAPDTGR